jgi:hypothetical protein
MENPEEMQIKNIDRDWRTIWGKRGEIEESYC